MTDFRVGGESFVVLSYPGCSQAIGAGLTDAERSVAMAAAILQKLGLRSRLDMAGDLRARNSGGRGGLS